MKKEKNIKKCLKTTKGITLVALVVTIVVLLILAGITITMLFSENGIIKKAEEAKQKTESGAADDSTGIGNLTNQMIESLDTSEKVTFTLKSFDIEDKLFKNAPDEENSVGVRDVPGLEASFSIPCGTTWREFFVEQGLSYNSDGDNARLGDFCSFTGLESFFRDGALYVCILNSASAGWVGAELINSDSGEMPILDDEIRPRSL